MRYINTNLLRFDLLDGVLLVRLVVEVREEHEEDGRVEQEERPDESWVAAVEPEQLGGVDEHQRELQLKSQRSASIFFRKVIRSDDFGKKKLN